MKRAESTAGKRLGQGAMTTLDGRRIGVSWVSEADEERAVPHASIVVFDPETEKEESLIVVVGDTVRLKKYSYKVTALRVDGEESERGFVMVERHDEAPTEQSP